MAKFQKGNKAASAKKGKKSAKSLAWARMAEKFENDLTDKAIEELEKLQGKDFLTHYEAILEHFKPKLNRTELTGGKEDDDKPIEIKLV